jgi:hypothetical protein
MTKKTIADIEHGINSLDRVLMLLRTECSAEDTLEGKLDVMKHQRYIEHLRARLRRELFDAMDEAGL